ncbi:hypothetical protein SOV_38870 [Sporomusa ovata DSM 2662]|uniref:hypothetical protein n=1 Tax=Sporomusa ovata TaxID=2378 RepID=UPI0003884E7F|nr:hypothetical protein [Sporomusa ovata]EQB26275.1 hypothetical protein SOV_3c01490 [Sporomusa ovata DSM 2662]
MSALFRCLSLTLLIVGCNMIAVYPIYASAALPQPVSGSYLMPPTVQLSGHVKLVDSYYYAVVELSNPTGKQVVVKYSDQSLHSLLQSALLSHNVVTFVGQNVGVSSPPRGGTWNMSVYNIDEVTLYDSP